MIEAAPRLVITCFGEFRVELARRDVTAALPGRQGRALLACLALSAPRPVSRDELVHTLWPTAAPAAPEAAFSSILAKVRRAVGPDLIVGREALALHPPPDAQVDVVDVAKAVDAAERALGDGDAGAALLLAQPAR